MTNGILNWARFYVSRGLSVIPIAPRAKTPHFELLKQVGAVNERGEPSTAPYFARQPTEEELRTWFEGKTPEEVGVGIVAGFNRLLILDDDALVADRLLWEDVSTWVSESAKGRHYFFFAPVPGENIEIPGKLELKAKNKYVVAPPSIHPSGKQYRWLADPGKVEVRRLTREEFQILNSHLRFLREHFPLIEALAKAWRPEHRHTLSLGLSGLLRKGGVPKENAERLLRAVCAFAGDPEVGDRLRALRDTYEKPVSEIAGVSILLGELEKVVGSDLAGRILELLPPRKRASARGEEEEKGPIFVSTPTVITKEFLAFQVYDKENGPAYCKYDLATGKFERATEIDLGETTPSGRQIIRVPVDNDHLRKGMVILPRWPRETSWGETLDLALKFVLDSGFYDAGEEREKVKLLALLAISSWFYPKIQEDLPVKVAGMGVFAPLLAIRGPSGSGKNRLINLLRFLSFRPFFDVSTARIPSLYRPLDLWGGTLVLDEADFEKTTETSELIHFLNCRATGTPISRQDPDNPREAQAFSNFGLTILTQRRHFEDNATEGRTIPFYSEKTLEKVPTVEPAELVERGMELQDRLLYLTLTSWGDFKMDRWAWLEEVEDPRLNATLLPLLALAEKEPKVKEVVGRVVKAVEEERRRLKALSEDGRMVNFLWEKIEAGYFAKWGEHYYITTEKMEEAEREGREFPRPLVASEAGKELGEWTAKRTKGVLQSIGVVSKDAPERIKIGRHTFRPLFFNPFKLEKLFREFVPEYAKGTLFRLLGLPTHIGSVTSVTSVTSPPRPSSPSVTEVTEVTLPMCVGGEKPKEGCGDVCAPSPSLGGEVGGVNKNKTSEMSKTSKPGQPTHIESVTTVTSVTEEQKEATHIGSVTTATSVTEEQNKAVTDVALVTDYMCVGGEKPCSEKTNTHKLGNFGNLGNCPPPSKGPITEITENLCVGGGKPEEGIGGEGDVCAPSPAPAQPQGGGEGAFAGSPPSLPPAPPETPAPQPQEEGSLWLVRFTEDYPGGLVGSLPGEIPGGACRVLTGWEVGELRRKFGFVEARKLEKGEVLVVRTLRPVPPGTFPWLSAELPPGKELVFLPDQAAELVSGGYAEILSTFEEWKTRQEGPNEGKAEEEPPHGTVQLILEFIRKKAPRPGMLVEKKDIYAWAGSLGISRERVDRVLRHLASRGVILDRGSVIERVR